MPKGWRLAFAGLAILALFWVASGQYIPPGGSGGGGTWGSITGTLSNQTDLNSALALKAPLISPSFTTPTLGTPASGDATNLTNVPVNQAKSGALLPNGNYYGVLKTNYVVASESTSSPSTAYAALTTPDSVTFTLAATTNVTFLFSAQCASNTVTTGVFSQFTVDTVDAASTGREFDATTANFLYNCDNSYSLSLATGSHTVLMKYKASGTSIQTFAHRMLVAYAAP